MNPPRRAPAIFARPLADYALRQIDPLVAKQGFGQSALILRWPEIVGERIAALCAPERLQWPPRPRRKTDDAKSSSSEPATLVLRVEPGFGLDIQHMTPAIIDRINAHLGWRCVSRIVQRQETTPLSPRAMRRPSQPRPAPPPDPAARARAETVVSGIADPTLQAVLLRLGENALRPQKIDKRQEPAG